MNIFHSLRSEVYLRWNIFFFHTQFVSFLLPDVLLIHSYLKISSLMMVIFWRQNSVHSNSQIQRTFNSVVQSMLVSINAKEFHAVMDKSAMVDGSERFHHNQPNLNFQCQLSFGWLVNQLAKVKKINFFPTSFNCIEFFSTFFLKNCFKFVFLSRNCQRFGFKIGAIKSDKSKITAQQSRQYVPKYPWQWIGVDTSVQLQWFGWANTYSCSNYKFSLEIINNPNYDRFSCFYLRPIDATMILKMALFAEKNNKKKKQRSSP